VHAGATMVSEMRKKEWKSCHAAPAMRCDSLHIVWTCRKSATPSAPRLRVLRLCIPDSWRNYRGDFNAPASSRGDHSF
jgi:hypothetical protein